MKSGFVAEEMCCIGYVVIPLTDSSFPRGTLRLKRLDNGRRAYGVAGLQGNALEESKKRAKSAFDNIPDLHEQYVRELQQVERKYGPKGMKKNIVRERAQSILAPVNKRGSAASTASTASSIKSADDYESQRQADLDAYERIRRKLLGDTVFLGVLGCCVVWAVGSIKAVGSYALGSFASLVYIFLLSRSVDRMAESAKETGMGSDGLQPARIALISLMFVAVGKNREHFDVLPVVMGFLTYKVATILPLITGEAFED